MTCKLCSGRLYRLGQLGALVWYRCRQCGMEFGKQAKDRSIK